MADDTAPSADDLMAETKALQQTLSAGSAAPNPDDLLAATRAVVPAASIPTMTVEGDTTAAAPSLAALRRKQLPPAPNVAWTSPAGRGIVANIPYIGNALAMAGDVLGYGLGAAGQVIGQGIGAAQQGVYNALSPINPQFARDVAALPEAFPLAGIELGGPYYRNSAGGRDIYAANTPPWGGLPVDVPAATQLRTGAPPAGWPWRPVAPGEDFVPGLTYRMNQQTGEREVYQPGAPGVAATPPPETPTPAATPPPPSAASTLTPEDRQWVNDTSARINDVVRQNAAAGGPADLSAAATPPALATLSPGQVKAYRRMSELAQITTPIVGEDNTEWVQGVMPTQAERLGDPNVSQNERLLRERRPEMFEGEQGALTKNNTLRVQAFDEALPTDIQADEIRTAKKAAAERDGQAFLAASGPVDLSGAATWLDQRLADPRVRENPYIAKPLQDLRDRLYDADGNLKSDPAAVWGMHDYLQAKLDQAKDPMSATSSEKFAVDQMVQFKKLVDGAADQASNGAFRTFLDNQAEYAKQLNAYDILNKFRFSRMINNKTGMIDPRAFNKFTTELAIKRGNPGLDPSMDIPDDVMQRIININQSLKQAGRIDLGSARGSNTNMMFALAESLGYGGAHMAMSHIPGGNWALEQGLGIMQRMRLNRAVRNALAPPEWGLQQPPGNPLNPPAP